MKRTKKLLVALLLGTIMALCGHFNVTSAEDVWFDTNEINQKYYLRTESIARNDNIIKCDTVLVLPSGKYKIEHVRFEYAVHTWNYRHPKGGLIAVTGMPHYNKLFNLVSEYIWK